MFNTRRQLDGALAVAVFGGLLIDLSTIVSWVRISLLIAAIAAAATTGATLRLRTSEHPRTDTTAEPARVARPTRGSP